MKPSPELTAFLRKLGNPYAKLSILDDPEDVPDPVRKWIRASQNPYASLQVVGSDETAGAASETASSKSHLLFENRQAPRVSKEAFIARCRRIFEQYVPLQQGRRKLDPEYTSFIAENSTRSPEERGRVLEELQKYDLSFLGNVTPYLNRERKDALKAKLKRISRGKNETE